MVIMFVVRQMMVASKMTGITRILQVEMPVITREISLLNPFKNDSICRKKKLYLLF